MRRANEAASDMPMTWQKIRRLLGSDCRSGNAGGLAARCRFDNRDSHSEGSSDGVRRCALARRSTSPATSLEGTGELAIFPLVHRNTGDPNSRRKCAGRQSANLAQDVVTACPKGHQDINFRRKDEQMLCIATTKS